MKTRIRFGFACLLCIVAVPLRAGEAADDAAITFDRDIRPILAARCFACHGPDEDAREADLRLDEFAGATADLGGYRAIEPGQPEKSEIVARISSDDPDVRMPPPDAGKPLSPEQVALVKAWIAHGGEYTAHWAFVPPVRPDVPAAQPADWPRNPIDHFVLKRLNAAGLSTSPEADRYALVRRVYLDLIGLPPTPEEADAFVQDEDPAAYEKLVDRLLASPHYGERWARAWLDLARYSDTNGYEKDRQRSIWPYRDWVIDALNADMPYDQFTVEQLAGDMLPGAAAAQRIATGFHRNTMLNEEGGIDPLEYRFYAMVDRVATTGAVWLGLTTGCAQCHSHKYDPITHTDYYRLLALLNNADEPEFRVPRTDLVERRRNLEAEIAAKQAALPEQFPPAAGDGNEAARRRANFASHLNAWITQQQKSVVDWRVVTPTEMQTNLPRLEVLEDDSIFSTGDITKRDVFTLRFSLEQFDEPITALRLEVMPDDRLPAGGPGRCYYEGREGDFFLSEVTARCGDSPVKLAAPSVSYGKISIGGGDATGQNVIDGDGSTGWSTANREGEAHQLVLNLAEPLAAQGQLELTMLFERHFAASLGRFRWSVATGTANAQATEMPAEIESILAREETTWSDGEKQAVRRYYAQVAPQLADARKPIDALKKQIPQLPATLVMQERPADNPRPTYRHHRGEYTQPKEQVAPGLPALFAAATPRQPTNRLELARWLVSRENPLVARVAVNRAWRALFGAGIVRTSGDFGTQSNPPSHPELLDWLACEFMDNGWSQKQLHRWIVTSATYRQSSQATPELLKRDAGNELLARGPRVRLDGELVRDLALAASGLLSPKMGGPSVYPPQPDSVTQLAYGNMKWPTSQGEDRYRRSLYTFSKRTAPFAAYATFDAPSGENCIARRDRSNTPLQALTLLNDEMYLEAARALGRKANSLPAAKPQTKAEYIFRRLLTRPPTAEEAAALVDYYAAQQKRLADGQLKPAQIAADKKADAQTAAWMMVARAVLNLDETIVKP